MTWKRFKRIIKRILKEARADRDALLAEAKTASIKIVNSMPKKKQKLKQIKLTAQAQETIRNEKTSSN